MTEWYAPIATFAEAHGYRFMGEFAFCRVEAPFGATRVHLWISRMGSGNARATLAGELAEWGEVHLRAKAKLGADLGLEIRRKNILDRLFARGTPAGDAVFDAKYVALGAPDDVRRFLVAPVVRAFLDMWPRTQGLCVEDGLVTQEGGQFSMDPNDLRFVIDTVGTIALGGAAASQHAARCP